MARKNGPSRRPNQSGRNKQNRPQRAGDFDNLALHVQREQELDPRNALGYKKINLSKEVSDSTNLRVKLLLSGLQGLEKFTKENSEETSDFYQQNKEQIDGLLKIKLDELYQKLVTNSQKRKGFEEKLVTDKVISLQQLNNMRGITDLQPYTNYINEISQEQQKTMHDYRKEVARINALPAPAPGAPANPPLPPMPVFLDGNDLDSLLKASPRNFADITRRLKDEGKLTDQQINKLTGFSPKSDEEIQRTKEQIFIEIKKHDLQNNSGYFDQYQHILREEEELIGQVDQYQERYNTLVKGLVKQIQEMINQDDYQKKRQKNLQKLRLRTGLPIKKGQILWGEDWSKDQTNFEVQRQHTNRIEIKDITYGVVEEDSELTPEFKQKVPTFEPIIHFTALAQDGSGQPIEYQLSANAFRKWVIGNNVIEKFDSLTDLEKSIGFPGLIKAGQTFEYVSYSLSTPGQAEPDEIKKTIKIEAVEGDLITLDQEVIIDYAVEGAGLRNPRVKKQLTFGEFSKWYGKNEAVPALDTLEKMNQFLSEHHRRLIAEMGWPENHGSPIDLNTSVPFFLISAYYPEGDFIELKKVEPDKITLGDGSELSPADFLRFTISEGLTWPTQDQLQELKQIAAAQKNEKKANKIEQVAKETPTAPSPAKTESTESGEGPVLSYFKSLWNDTTFLNLMEIYELFVKAPSDRVEEWLKDKSERKISKVGQDFYKGFPDLGGLSDLSSTYEDKLNGKIAGDVKGAEEFFEKNYDTAKVLEVMYGASDPTTLKACLQFLSKKGALRWEDDDKLHAVLNKVLKPAVYPSKFHQAVGGDNVSVIVNHKEVLEKVETMSVFDQLEIRLDNHYGEGTYDSLFNANEKVYRDTREKTRGEMHKYEHMQGGILVQLQKMLDDWQKGLPVDAAVFDGLLVGGINGEEFSPDQAILLLISAFGMPNPDGKYILTFSKLNPYVKDLSDQLMYIFFAVGHDQVDEKGLPKKVFNEKGEEVAKRGKFGSNNFAKVFREIISKDITASRKSDHTKFIAGKNTMNWIQREILTTGKVKDRASTKAGNPNTGITYYTHMGPLMSEETDINKVIRTYGGSNVKPEIVRTIYAGYNNQLAIKAKRLDEKKDPQIRTLEFAQMVKGFFYFNDILRSRIKTTHEDYMRMSDSALDVPPGVDKEKKTIVFVKEVEDFTKKFTQELIDLSGDAQLRDLAYKTVLSGAPSYRDEDASAFRERLYSVILEQQKKDQKKQAEGRLKPGEKTLATIAAESSNVMKGMSGKQLDSAELKALRGE